VGIHLDRDLDRALLFAPLIGLLILILVLFSPQIVNLFDSSAEVPGLSDLRFAEKTELLLTFAIAFFAAVEGYATYKRATLEYRSHKIQDARNELEKAYGPLFTLLNKNITSDEKTNFWLDFEERKEINKIMATYPFMFSKEINDFWREKIQSPKALVQDSDIEPTGVDIDLRPFAELREMITKEYIDRVKNYRKFFEK
jgi:hypothetical protein